jgi:cation:H+ antiporter
VPDFAQLGLAANLAIFAAAAALVWASGTRIAAYADAISERTGLGQALLGLLLLGGVTSLPELAVTTSAAYSGDAALAVNNILGGVTMQVAILAIADAAIGRRALTAVVPDPIVMLQGALGVLLLAIVAAGALVGDHAVLGVGLWSWGVLLFTLFSLWKLSQAGSRKPWMANTELVRLPKPRAREGDQSKRQADESGPALLGKTVAAAAIILAAGFALSSTAEVIAEQTGLGSSFVGAVLVAIATSLPEVSTVLAAVRLGLYTMAISDILGTNIFDVGLVFVTDAVAAGEPVLSRVGDFSVFGALLGIVATTLFLMGVAERRDRTILRMGTDSLAVLVVYLGGLVILWTLR